MTTSKDTSTQITTRLIDAYSVEELARALVGAFTLLSALRCPNCESTLEATVESTTETSRKQSGGGGD